jgi:hypothetical protein
MSSPQQSMPFWLAHSSLQLALRLWPEGSRDWGQALAAELDEIEEPFEALQWALGGLMLFSRASASHFLAWLKLPAGSRLSAASLPLGPDAPILPKRSRLFTAAVLVATALLLFLPRSREAISTVRASWNGYRGYSSDVRALRNLAALAEKERDARTLAFVALATPDANRAMALADHAVAIDPSLFWIYANSTCHPRCAPLTKDRLDLLLSADPDNAFPELVAARVISEPLFQRLIFHHSPTQTEFETSFAADPQWIAHMERAFRAPRYDSYVNRLWQLTREVWNQHQDLSASVIFNTLWARSFPDVTSIRLYGNHLVQNAQEASAAGRPDEAESLLKRVDDFGHRMSEQCENDFERMVGLSLSYQATKEFRNLYQSHGMERQAQEAAHQLQDVDGRIEESLRHSFRPPSPAQLRFFDRRAFLVQLSAVLAMLFAIAAAFSLFTLELPLGRRGQQRIRLRRAICVAADWAPTALLFGCVALLWLFRPYAEILRSARNLGSASQAWHSMHFEGLFTLSATLGALEEPFTPVHLWQAFICALVALALFVLVRGFLRHKHA